LQLPCPLQASSLPQKFCSSAAAAAFLRASSAAASRSAMRSSAPVGEPMEPTSSSGPEAAFFFSRAFSSGSLSSLAFFFAAAAAVPSGFSQAAPSQPSSQAQRPWRRLHVPCWHGAGHSGGASVHFSPVHPGSHLHAAPSQAPWPLHMASKHGMGMPQAAPIHPGEQMHVSGMEQSPWPLQHAEMEQSTPMKPATQRQEPSMHSPWCEQKFGQKFSQESPVYPV